MTEAPIGLIAAVPEELAHLRHAFTEAGRRKLAGLDFLEGRLDGVPVAAVEAGIGKVNAAVVATLLLHEFGCRALLLTGVAGGLDPDLKVGDVVVARRLVAHDYGALVEGEIRPYQPGTPPLPGVPDTHGYELPAALAERVRAALAGLALPPLSAAATGETPHVPRIVFGTILTGDSFLNCETTRRKLHARFAAAAVEMEGAAIAQVAERFGVPWVVIRALSDLAGADSHMDFPAFLQETAGLAAKLARRLVQAL